MALKLTSLFVFLLFISGSFGRRCFQCAASNTEQCERLRREINCNSGYNYCFTFNGTITTQQGFRQPHAEKGCGLQNTCNIIQQTPNITLTHCRVCSRNLCNSSNLISGGPVMIIALLAFFQKIL